MPIVPAMDSRVLHTTASISHGHLPGGPLGRPALEATAHKASEALNAALSKFKREQDKPPVILVVHASVGSGHKSAAFAIQEALQNLKASGDGRIPQDCEIRLVDILDFGFIKFNGDRTASAFTGPTRVFYDYSWRYGFTGVVLWGGGTIWSRLMFKPFTDYLSKVDPIAAVATHIVAANCVSCARTLNNQKYPVVCVPTDYEVEGLWPHTDADLFCVANETMAETLRNRKVEEERIAITGIPVRGGYERSFDPLESRAHFGLPTSMRVVLIMSGAHLKQPYVRFRQTIDEFFPYIKRFKDTLHFVFLPGKDQEYRNHLEQLVQIHQVSNATILDYVTEMPRLMSACDFAICKAGGLTVTECLCARLPMVLLGRTYGQERVNSRMLTSLGISLHVTTARELYGAVKHLSDHPEALAAMRVNGDALRRPNAAADIAQCTLDLVGNDYQPKRHFMKLYLGHRPAHRR